MFTETRGKGTVQSQFLPHMLNLNYNLEVEEEQNQLILYPEIYRQL